MLSHMLYTTAPEPADRQLDCGTPSATLPVERRHPGYRRPFQLERCLLFHLTSVAEALAQLNLSGDQLTPSGILLKTTTARDLQGIPLDQPSASFREFTASFTIPKISSAALVPGMIADLKPSWIVMVAIGLVCTLKARCRLHFDYPDRLSRPPL